MNQTTSHKWLKSINQQKVLRLIYADGPISRVQLAEKTALTQQTVTNVVNRLLADGIVLEQEPVTGRVGRKPVPLVINSGNLYAIGIEVAVPYIQGTLVDFDNKPIAGVTRPLTTNREEGYVISNIEEVIDQLLGQVSELSQLQGIGLSIQGLVDASRGVVINASGLEWRNYPLGEYLEKHYNLPVYVENDANLLALVENLNGCLAGSAHNLTFKFDYGIGAAHVMNKQLNAGAAHVAGEMGHYKAVIGAHAKQCHCGGRGCLTTIASGSGIRRNFGCKLEEFGERVRMMDAAALEWLSMLEEAVGLAVSNMVTFLNPDHVLITGRLVEQLGSRFMDPLKQRIQDNIPETCRSVKLVERLRTPDDSILAAGLVMNRFFDIPSVQVQVY